MKRSQQELNKIFNRIKLGSYVKINKTLTGRTPWLLFDDAGCQCLLIPRLNIDSEYYIRKNRHEKWVEL